MLRINIDGEDVDLDDAKMLNTEAIALKKVSGFTVKTLWEGVGDFDGEALTAMVWLARRRNGEQARYPGPEFDLSTLDIRELDEDGRVVIRDKTGAITEIDGEPVEPDPTQPASEPTEPS